MPILPTWLTLWTICDWNRFSNDKDVILVVHASFPIIEKSFSKSCVHPDDKFVHTSFPGKSSLLFEEKTLHFFHVHTSFPCPLHSTFLFTNFIEGPVWCVPRFKKSVPKYDAAPLRWSSNAMVHLLVFPPAPFLIWKPKRHTWPPSEHSIHIIFHIPIVNLNPNCTSLERDLYVLIPLDIQDKNK